ncbi:hypothetical protein AXF42_Ash003535 [Apostasia shenzhenica]|uniref:Uncharacterized protein n=1 Tax=Apostasia shenzhenica TaxID=1088818 RepID=A0A2I0BGF4_9ASPA|nr:hypothetical protein AXF42_Ash003535 [Apostasia shenzhenica]
MTSSPPLLRGLRRPKRGGSRAAAGRRPRVVVQLSPVLPGHEAPPYRRRGRRLPLRHPIHRGLRSHRRRRGLRLRRRRRRLLGARLDGRRRGHNKGSLVLRHLCHGGACRRRRKLHNPVEKQARRTYGGDEFMNL